MWGMIGGLMVVGAVIFFVQGYPGRALVLLSPFALFGVVVLLLTLYQSAKNRRTQRLRQAAEDEQKMRQAMRNREEAHKIRAVRDRALSDIAELEAALTRQRSLTAQRLSESRQAGAPSPKIEALEHCERDLQNALTVYDREIHWVLPRLRLARTFHAQVTAKVASDWSEEVAYTVWQESDGTEYWRTREVRTAGDLAAIALGAHADGIRKSWPQLIEELSLEHYSLKNFGP